MRNLLLSIKAERGGATAVEFAIVAPAFFLFIIGTMNLGLMLFTMGAMQYAVEDAARCASVKTTICNTSAATIAYAKSRYFSPLVKTTFSYSTPSCGKKVTATATYSFLSGDSRTSVPLSASNCYP